MTTNNLNAIASKYWHALAALRGEVDPHDDIAILLALQLAVHDAAQHQPNPPQDFTQHQTDWLTDQIARLNEWLAEHAVDLYIDPYIDTAAAIIAAADQLRGQVAKLSLELGTAIDERNQLLQELASVADCAVLGASVVPASAPAQLDPSRLSQNARDYLVGIEAGRWSWRKLPKGVRLEMLQAVLGDGMTMAEFDAAKPDWMPAAAGHPTTYGCSWAELATLAYD